MFTHFIPSRGGYATEEWLITPRTSTSIYYGKFSASTGWTLIRNEAISPDAGMTSDGKFIFNTHATAGISQYSWNGSAFTLVETETSIGGGGNAPRAIKYSGYPTRVILQGHLAFGNGISLVEYDQAPTYTMTNLDNEEPANDNWQGLVGIRMANKGILTAFPDLVVCGADTARSYVASANPLSALGNVAVAAELAGDADSGLLVAQSGTTTIPMYQANTTTGALSSVGTSSAIVSRRHAACSKGFVVILGTDATLRSYSVSGTTLTEVSNVASGFTDNANNKVTASPFTGFLYCSRTGADGRVFDISSAGTLTFLNTFGGRDEGTGELFNRQIAFIPQALTVT